MHGIPTVLDSDAEDVAWALQTAEALWKRAEHVDAIVWLRRAAQAAGDAGADERAVHLARGAAELSEWLAEQKQSAPEPQPHSVPIPPGTPPEEARRAQLRTDPPAASEETNVGPLPSFPLESSLPPPDDAPTPLMPQVAPKAPPAPDVPLPSFPLEEQSIELVSAELQSAEIMSAEMTRRIMESVRPSPDDDSSATAAEPAANPSGAAPAPTAADVHAGMLDPWAEERKSSQIATSVEMPPSTPRTEPQVPRAASHFDDEEIVTSAQPLDPSQGLPAQSPHESPTKQYATLDDAPASAMPVSTLEVVGDAPPPAPPASPAAPAPPRAAPTPHASAPKPPPLPPRPAPQKPPPPKPPVPPHAPPSAPAVAAAAPLASAAPARQPAAPGRRVSVRPPSAVPMLATDGKLDLASVDGLGDLPDEEREAFAGAANVNALKREEEVSGFALALIIQGEVDVAATVIDAPAARVGTGSVLRSRGTTEEGVPIRLVCASDDAKVATWNDAAVNTAFSTCPWVEDDLRAAADRIQALVGVTVGPLGERLDPALRGQVTSRLEVRSLAGGEIIVQRGQPVPGMFIVGVGEVEVLEGDAVNRVVMCGEFLFPEAILGAGPAPAVARAGAGGALVLFGSRALAQELLVTCPPLLEVFAGM
jgi:hypothetical protein